MCVCVNVWLLVLTVLHACLILLLQFWLRRRKNYVSILASNALLTLTVDDALSFPFFRFPLPLLPFAFFFFPYAVRR